MATFARRVVLDVGAGEVRIAEISPDKRGEPVLTLLRSISLTIDPTKPAEFFPAVMQSICSLV
jgi:hypothetical protein